MIASKPILTTNNFSTHVSACLFTPDSQVFIRTLAVGDAGTFSKTDALREYLEAKRRWEIHRFTCPQVRGIYKSGPGPEELSLTEDTNTPNERRKINHKAKLPQPLYDQPLEEEAPAVRPFSDEEYGRLSVRCSPVFLPQRRYTEMNKICGQLDSACYSVCSD